MNTVFCADIGTSSLKAAVIDSSGNVLSYSRKTFPKTEINRESSVWLGTLKSAMDEIFEKGDVQVDALCVSGNGPTIVGQNGETLLWNAPLPQDAVRSFLTPSLFVPRLYGFSKMFPQAWNPDATVFSGPEYLIYQLTGSSVTILPEIRYTEAYWTDESLTEAGLKEGCPNLPSFVIPSAVAGVLTEEKAHYLSHKDSGIVEGIKVFCGAPDFVSALVGTGTIEPGKLCDRAGSSEGLNLCTAEKICAPGIRTLPSVVSGLWNASILLPDTGIKFAAYKTRLEEYMGRPLSYEEAVHMTITSDGMEAILDQGKYTMLETAMKIRDGLAILRNAVSGSATPFPSEFTVTGGQSGNEEWLKMKCDVTGMKARIPVCHDAELVGDAIFAFLGDGKYKSLKEACDSMCQFGGELMQGAFLE